MKKVFGLCVMLTILCSVAGCRTGGNTGKMEVFEIPSGEPVWIRDGEPVEFEGELWYPQDSVDVLLDSEVLKAGRYRGVEFFIDKVDVRPFNRIYTKFGRNKFRAFEKKVKP